MHYAEMIKSQNRDKVNQGSASNDQATSMEVKQLKRSTSINQSANKKFHFQNLELSLQLKHEFH